MRFLSVAQAMTARRSGAAYVLVRKRRTRLYFKRFRGGYARQHKIGRDYILFGAFIVFYNRIFLQIFISPLRKSRYKKRAAANLLPRNRRGKGRNERNTQHFGMGAYVFVHFGAFRDL